MFFVGVSVLIKPFITHWYPVKISNLNIKVINENIFWRALKFEQLPQNIHMKNIVISLTNAKEPFI